MSIARVTLDAIRTGEYTAPAEQASVCVTQGPWRTSGRHLFARAKGESEDDWRIKVLASADAARVRSPAPPLNHVIAMLL